MSIERHPDWYETVRANWPRTTGFLLASQDPCIKIRGEELDAVRGRRVLVGVGPESLATWVPPESWLLAVILCPGDDVEALLVWAKRHRVDSGRVMFFLHPKADAEILRPWRDAGYSTARVDTVASWPLLHKLFGLALNDRVYEDATAPKG